MDITRKTLETVVVQIQRYKIVQTTWVKENILWLHQELSTAAVHAVDECKAGGAARAGQVMTWANIFGLQGNRIALAWVLPSNYQLYRALLCTINAHGLTIIFVLPPALECHSIKVAWIESTFDCGSARDIWKIRHLYSTNELDCEVGSWFYCWRGEVFVD